MKKIIALSLLTVASLVGCKNTEKENTAKTVSDPKAVAEKIAEAHGFANWKNVAEIGFTFNVDRDTAHYERSWLWNVKTQDVRLISGNDTIQFNRGSVTDSLRQADSGFVNDKFWFLFPYQLMWDKGTVLTYSEKEIAPISKKEMHKLTVVYPDSGGYSPGDGYDAYFGDDYVLQEWIYRKGHAVEPSLITTWESYSDIHGLKIATTHIKDSGNWKLYFTNVTVIPKL